MSYINSIYFFWLHAFLVCSIHFLGADVKSTDGQILFDVNNDDQFEAKLDTTGLGIGISPSANLEINGNAIITNSLNIGVGDSNANLHLSGTMAFGHSTVTNDQDLGSTSLVFADTSNDNLLLNLPSPSSVTGQIISVKKIDDDNDLFIRVQSGGNIETGNFLSLMNDGELPMIKLISSGERWNILSELGSISNFGIVFFEAESGSIGTNFMTAVQDSTLSGNVVFPIEAQGGDSPNDLEGIITYSVPLNAGTYDLYVRFLVGPGGGTDDSFFIGNGFGTKNISTDSDWITVNSLTETANAYTNPEGQEITNNTYSWVKMSSQSTISETVPTFTSTGATETFMIAHREDGLLIDALAFVTTGETVSSKLLSSQSSFFTSSQSNLIGVEAESGVLGANYTISSNSLALGGNVISPVGDQGGESPDQTADIATYTINIPEGFYNLYVRFLVGPSGGNDDSFFIGDGFGTKTVSVDDEWLHINSLTDGGNAYLDPEGTQITDNNFSWVKMTLQVNNTETVPYFYSDGTPQTFMLAHRENGFLIDAFVFASLSLDPSSAELSSAVTD